MAEAIQSHPDVSGVEVAGTSHKLSLFADDILLTITKPRISLPNLLSLLDSFALFSGLAVNQAKSKAMSINICPSDLDSLRSAFPFQWLTSLPYLGIKLVPKYSQLYQANFPSLFGKLTVMLTSWSTLPFSWFGRVATVRMTYLPKLPVQVPSHILRIHQRKIMQFIWGTKRPRIKRQVLFARRINGGLSVPNLQAYYTAAGIAPLSRLHEKQQMPLWATFDLVDSHPIPLASLPWLPRAHRPPSIGPCLAHSLRLWDSVKYSAGLISPHLPLLCFLHNPLFPPGRDNPLQSAWWTEHGFVDVHSMLSPTKIISYSLLRSSHDIPLREHYSYLQLRHFLQRLIRSQPTPYTMTPFESLCRSRPHSPGLISLIYTAIINSKRPPLRPYHLQWEAEFGRQLDPEDWQAMTVALSKCSTNVLFQENAYKVFYRWYYTPARLASFIPSYSPLCFRGCSQEGTMAHIWWTCPKVCRLWVRVYALLRNLFDTNLKKDPFEALLWKPITELLRPERQLAAHVFTATKLIIARAWKTLILSFEAVKNCINDIMVNEKLTAVLADTHDKFLRVWQPWVANNHPSRFNPTLLSL